MRCAEQRTLLPVHRDKFSKPGFNLGDIFVNVCAGGDSMKVRVYLDGPTTLCLIADTVLESSR